MSLSKSDFLQTWKESTEPYLQETAWQRYQQTQASSHQTTPESSDLSAEALQSHFKAFLAHSPIASSIESYKFITRHANNLPWKATGLHLKPGQQVSTFATGRVWRSRPLDLYIGPWFALWFRVGVNGRVFNSTRSSNTFTVDRDTKAGELYLANQFPAWWQEQSGRVVGDLAQYQNGGDGKFEILVIVWKDGANVQKLITDFPETSQSDLLKLEASRPEEERSAALPQDWYYFWFIGRSTIYRALQAENNKKCIHTKVNKDIGILMKDLDPVPVFEEGVRAKWNWKVDALPSRLREDTTFSHDYLSVAFEFENGRDITYTWSWELPVDYGYWCPLPTWEAREYHVVIRSGEKGLGEWLSEERDLFADYNKYIGPKGGIPERITRVWLIANGAFQRLDGEMTVEGIQIHGRDNVTEVI